MNTDKKVAIQQQRIEELERENQKLQQENDVLKQMIPNGTDVLPVKDVYTRLEKVLADALALKKQYEALCSEASKFMLDKKAEVNELLTRLRGDVARAEARRSQMAQDQK